MEFKSVLELIGNTPLIYLKKLSEKTGNILLAKAEHLNPGGSVKDRTAFGIIRHLIQLGQINHDSVLYEGTAGNTGIGLALVTKHFGYKLHLVLPNNQSKEKYQFLEMLGANLHLVDPVPFSDPRHFYHTAARMASQDPKGVWLNQFENVGNFEIHYETTGKEIWEQTGGELSFFGCSAGTGGSMAGISCFLKEKNPSVHVRLFDPFGSGLHEYVTTGQIKTEGQSISEGIGIMRVTENFKKARVDDSVRISDRDMMGMLSWLAKNEGIFVGLSAALNAMGLYQWAMENKNKGLMGVTLICDGGHRYESKIYEYLKKNPDLKNYTL